MTILGGLIQNASLLLALVLAYSLFIDRLPRERLSTQLVQGLLFGITALIGMTYPVTLAPGVIFDARTVVIAMAGVFTGVVPTAIATVIAAAFRAWIGGPGTVVGIAVTLTAAALGLGFGYRRRAVKLAVNPWTLGALGLIVHLASVAWFLLLPQPVRAQVLSQIALPYLFVLPAVTVLLGLMLRMQEQRRDDERALRISQARLVEAQRIAGIGDWDWDLGSDRQDWSPVLHRLYGRDPAFPPRPFPAVCELYSDETWAGLAAAIEAAWRDGKPFACEAEIVRPDGSRRWATVQGEAIRATEGPITRLRGTVADITEREELHQRIAKIAEHVPGVLYQYQQWPDGRATFPYASHGIQAIYGIEPEQVADDATPAFESLHPHDLERIKDSISQSFESLETWKERFRVRFPDGRTIWAEGESSPEQHPDGSVLWHGYIRDITDTVRAEQILRESQQKLLDAQFVARMGDFEWEIQTGKVIWSAGLYRLLGYDPDDPIDFTTVNARIHHPDDLPRVTRWLQDAISSDSNELTPNEYRLVRKDGAVIEVQTQGWITRDTGKATKIFGTALDITERKRAEAQLQLAASVFAHSREGIIITDANNRIVDVNPSFERITGYEKAQVLGQDPKLLTSGRQDSAFYAAMWGALRRDGFWQGEIWNRRRDGGIFPEMLSISVVRDGDGAVRNHIGVFSDISEVKAHEAQLDHVANHDPLTGLPNRRLLTDRLQQALTRRRRTDRVTAVCYLDLDGFKKINDHHGHETGDRLLVNVARALRKILRDEDTIARLGGDEFVLLLTDLMQPDDCVVFLNRILASIRDESLMDDIAQTVSASIGVTLCPPDCADPDGMLRHADQAMYRAKESGKNTYHLYDAEQDRLMHARRSQREQLRRAVENQELVLWFQPEVDLISREVERVEALLRWQHPEKGLLLPGDFLPDIEGTELEVAVDEWVVDAAIRQHLDWFRQGRPLHISINIGANHLLRPDFFARLMQRFSDIHGSQVKGFELEILETAALSDFEQAMLVVSDCRAAGLKIALDDFGTGYSSLAYLRRLPVDRIKIDQAFVRDMLEDSGDMEIVESIIRLAASLGRAVIAEGVETLDHAALLAWLGCRHGQGYGIARPMPATDLPAWMQQWSAQRGWPEAEPEHADQHPELPILVAAQNHRYWLHRFDAATAMADFDRLEEFAGARCPFTSWHEGAGKEHFGKLSEFEAAGQAHYRLHRLAEALAAQQRADPDRAPHPESLHQIRRASGDLLRALQGLVKRVRSSGPTDGE